MSASSSARPAIAASAGRPRGRRRRRPRPRRRAARPRSRPRAGRRRRSRRGRTPARPAARAALRRRRPAATGAWLRQATQSRPPPPPAARYRGPPSPGRRPTAGPADLPGLPARAVACGGRCPVCPVCPAEPARRDRPRRARVRRGARPAARGGVVGHEDRPARRSGRASSPTSRRCGPRPATSATSTAASTRGYLFPMGPFFALGDLAGLPAVARAPAVARRRAGRRGVGRRPARRRAASPRGGRPARLAAGAVFLLNPYVVVFANRTSVTLLGVRAAAVDAARRPPRAARTRAAGGGPRRSRCSWRASGGGVNVAVMAWLLLAPLALLVYEPAIGAVSWRDARGVRAAGRRLPRRRVAVVGRAGGRARALRPRLPALHGAAGRDLGHHQRVRGAAAHGLLDLVHRRRLRRRPAAVHLRRRA